MKSLKFEFTLQEVRSTTCISMTSLFQSGPTSQFLFLDILHPQDLVMVLQL